MRPLEPGNVGYRAGPPSLYARCENYGDVRDEIARELARLNGGTFPASPMFPAQWEHPATTTSKNTQHGLISEPGLSRYEDTAREGVAGLSRTLTAQAQPGLFGEAERQTDFQLTSSRPEQESSMERLPGVGSPQLNTDQPHRGERACSTTTATLISPTNISRISHSDWQDLLDQQKSSIPSRPPPPIPTGSENTAPVTHASSAGRVQYPQLAPLPTSGDSPAGMNATRSAEYPTLPSAPALSAMISETLATDEEHRDSVCTSADGQRRRSSKGKPVLGGDKCVDPRQEKPGQRNEEGAAGESVS